VPIDVLLQCKAEADRFYPLETGGTFMGYLAQDCIVVDEVIGPGPGADHDRYGFTPDQTWQEAKIAEFYEASGRQSTYVGDWHSHPDATTGKLSNKDISVLKRVALHDAARCSRPGMVILSGAPSTWRAEAWSVDIQRRFWLLSAATAYGVPVRLWNRSASPEPG
jgi:integrative and conjugative element protein (TIGR02256 family)